MYHHDKMHTIRDLSQMMYCYNRCVYHSKQHQESMKRKLEDSGIVFYNYRGKLYFQEYAPYQKSTFWTEEEKVDLCFLTKLLNDFNCDISVVEKHKCAEEFKSIGFYLVKIHDVYYFSEFRAYELITGFHKYLPLLPIMDKALYFRAYQRYKKHV